MGFISTIAAVTMVTLMAQAGPSTTEKVDRYIQETHIQKQSSEDANPYIGSHLPPPSPKKVRKEDFLTPDTETTGVQLDEYHPHKSKEPLLKTPDEPVRNTVPDEVIERQVQKNRENRIRESNLYLQQQGLEAADRRAYIEQLKQNAARDGIILQISDDNQVTGYKRIEPNPKPKPRAPTSRSSR